MSRTAARLLYWSPRILSIAFALFLSLFALEVLNQAHGVRQIAPAFAMQLIPALIMVVLLLIAWRWEPIGTALFSLTAAWYAVHMLRRNVNNWPAVLVISLPLLIIAALFLADWIERPKLRPAS